MEKERGKKRKRRRGIGGRKKKEKNERWEKEILKINTEGQIWEVVRKERRKRKGVNKGIKMED